MSKKYLVKPAWLQPGETVTTFGTVFDAPLVGKGRSWLPLVPLLAWPLMAWVAKRRQPTRTWLQSLGVGALTMPVVLGSEWAHNLAHAAAAKGVGKPTEAIRIIFGMPLLVYHDLNDQTVTPQEHMVRAAGGPVFNLALLPLLWVGRVRAGKGSLRRELLEVAWGVNLFLPVVGLLPIPGLDGGPLLKWGLVARGHTLAEADQRVRRVDGVLGSLLAGLGLEALRRKRRLLGGLLLQLAAVALSIALGIFKEQETPDEI